MMINSELFSEISSTIKHNKVRTFLTAFGVFLGIFMLVLLVGAGNGLTGGITSQFAGFASNSAFLGASKTSIAYSGFQIGRGWSIDNADVKSIKHNVSGLQNAIPRVSSSWLGLSTNNVVKGDKTTSNTIYGDYPDYMEVDQMDIIQGRWINGLDIEKRRKVCVIGEKVLSDLFSAEENPIGQFLKINSIYYQVIGVHHPISNNMNFGGDKQESIIIPFSTMQQNYNIGDKVHLLCILAKDNYPVSKVEAETKALIQRRHRISPDDKQAIWSFNIQEELDKFLNLFHSINVLSIIVGGGTLLAGLIGVGNIMLVAIKERTKTIGIQRAIGATPIQVVTPILLESIIITSISGFVGLSSGVFLLQLIKMALEKSDGMGEFFTRYMQIDFFVALGALGVLIVGGIFAGALPAQRALRINPVDALRDE